MLVSFNELKKTLYEKLLKLGANEGIAEKASQIIAENDLDGVSSHGTARFKRIADMVKCGTLIINNTATPVSSKGAMEVWDGKLGLGVINASICMDRAMALAEKNGIGCVALRNTNHWLRGASYGIQAAKKGYVALCWTNTTPNMPAWGTKEQCLGNNPLIFAAPYKDSYIVMDGALAQYSYGALGKAASEGRTLPYPGGYDSEGKLSCNPAEISKTRRVLPIGFWKGSGISLLLDIIVSGLSNGLCVPEIGKLGSKTTDERMLCQMFIAIKPENARAMDIKTEAIIEAVKHAEAVDSETKIRIPGEGSLSKREKNLRDGITVDDGIWQTIVSV
ncbi:MAG: 3-dehydro-L-gulonate 2-dehydrogenase [Sphaerochaetaceae bacterium]|nr:3-dehydro-L-gulonate 2-dehydrogenase [Sphaerochaetaceae bacterium]